MRAHVHTHTYTPTLTSVVLYLLLMDSQIAPEDGAVAVGTVGQRNQAKFRTQICEVLCQPNFVFHPNQSRHISLTIMITTPIAGSDDLQLLFNGEKLNPCPNLSLTLILAQSHSYPDPPRPSLIRTLNRLGSGILQHTCVEEAKRTKA